MIGRRCHCGCRARLDDCNVRAHAKYASTTCKARDWKRRRPKASTSTEQSQMTVVGCKTQPTRPHVYSSAYAWAHDLPLTGGESRAMDPSSSSNRLRDCSTSRSVAHTREAKPPIIDPNTGQFTPDTGERERESDNRQFVRWALGGCPDMPHLPASREPKRKHQPDPPVNRVLNALLGAGCTYRPARSVDEWEAHCPTHEDSKPSLVVRRNGDGSVWIKDWAGCSKEAILDALGLEWRDLWDASENDYGRRDALKPKPLLPAHLRRAMEDLLRLDDERRKAA